MAFLHGTAASNPVLVFSKSGKGRIFMPNDFSSFSHITLKLCCILIHLSDQHKKGFSAHLGDGHSGASSSSSQLLILN